MQPRGRNEGLQKTNDVSLSIGNLAVAWHRSNDAVAERAARLPQTLKFHSARRRPTRQSIGLKFETNCSFTLSPQSFIWQVIFSLTLK